MPILYRPFDVRYTYYTGHSRGFLCMPRQEVMRHMLQQNAALVVPRQCKEQPGAFVCSAIAGHKTVDAYDINYLFPLYCYYALFSAETGSIRSSSGIGNLRRANLDPDVVGNVAKDMGFVVVADGRGDPTQGTMGPEDLFAYIYAALYSPVYRERYAEFLKADFPRIPFTKDRDTFLKLATLGQQLIDLHLMRSPELDNPISRFCGKGDSAVTKIEYDADRGRVSINPTQYFDGVTPDLWSYQIGGYHVLSKWLKDRKGRFLTSADTIHYSRIVTALARTIAAQLLIDNNLEAAEVWSPLVVRLAVVQ